MDTEDLQPLRANDPLSALQLQDLDPLSVTELDARVAALQAEIARTRAKRESAAAFRSAADGLFRR